MLEKPWLKIIRIRRVERCEKAIIFYNESIFDISNSVIEQRQQHWQEYK